MEMKWKQNVSLLAVSSLLLLAASMNMSGGASALRDFFQGLMTGMGIAGSLLAITIFAKNYKRHA